MNQKNSEIVENQIKVLFVRKNFSGEDLADAKLQGLDFRGCLMGGVILDEADLTGANLKGCELHWGILFNTNFKGANLAHAKLNGASLDGADFTNANLCGADFGNYGLGRATNLSGANFTNAAYDDTTVLPANFDPISHGMVRKLKV